MGVPPIVAISFALTLAIYHPILCGVNVIGSDFAMRYLSPKSMTAASSPTFGPTITLGSFMSIVFKEFIKDPYR